MEKQDKHHVRKNCWVGLATEIKPEISTIWTSLQILRRSEVYAKSFSEFIPKSPNYIKTVFLRILCKTIWGNQTNNR